MKRMACALAFAAGSGIAWGAGANPALGAPLPSEAGSGLQLNLSGSSTLANTGKVALDVRFRGGNLNAVELYADGRLIKKQAIRTRDGRGVLHFDVDGALLPEGPHEILVKAFDRDGSTATASARIQVVPDGVDALVRLVSPARGATVQGVVPITVKIDSAVRSPYVTFFVDNDFQLLINYPPYTYNWDSTRVSNGAHSIGVEVLDGETLNKVKTHSFELDVKNPGGFTTRQAAPPDLNHSTRPGTPAAAPPTVVETRRAVAELASPTDRTELLPSDVSPARTRQGQAGAFALRTGGAPHSASTAPRPGPTATWLREMPGVLPPSLNASQFVAAKSGSGRAIATRRESVRPPLRAAARTTALPRAGLAAVLANPDELQESTGLLVPGRMARQAASPHRSGNFAVEPKAAHIAAPVPSKARPVQTARAGAGASLAGPTAARAAAHVQFGMAALAHLHGKSFAISYNNARLLFDVPPRVEHGVPLAPFRQIFEHSGGRVTWSGTAQTVRAVSDTRTVSFRIGETKAKVNDRLLTLEKTPFLDRGRAIVPLSFVRDALDVTIDFDPDTGHLRIESSRP